MISELTFGIVGWTNKEILRLQNSLIEQGVTTENKIIVRDSVKSLSKNTNEILDEAQTDLVYVLTADVEIVDPSWVEPMYYYMAENLSVGLLYCWNDGRPFAFGAPVYDNPVGTGPNLMIRASLEVRMDEDFIISQFEEQDLGREMVYRGHRVCFDQRVSVYHPPTDYSRKDKFYQACSLRNRLLLETKWREVGRKNWQGVRWWNKRKKWLIPTLSMLKRWSRRDLKNFEKEANKVLKELLVLELKI